MAAPDHRLRRSRAALVSLGPGRDYAHRWTPIGSLLVGTNPTKSTPASLVRSAVGFSSALLLALVVVPAATAQTGQPTRAEIELEDLEFVEIFRGVARATSVTHAGDGSGRLFVTEQVGRILVYDGQSLLSTPFLDIRQRVLAGGERGLLSVAFHPNHSLNGYFFINYTDLGGDTVVSRFAVSDDPNVADAGTETIFFEAAQPRRNHNGGQIQFGPDGHLYIGMGDGGGAGDPPNVAQDLDSVLGKMLRVDIDLGPPATAPASNPFLKTPGAPPEIWAYGLRNPWRFSFDRLTGDMFIGDVGQNAMEEISFQPASSEGGENYGWRRMEGSLCFRPRTNCNDGSLVLPILEYENFGSNCGGSVTGGYRYRGAMFPELSGVYFFADYCTGDFHAAVQEDGAWKQLSPRSTPFGVRTFGEDEAGEIYFADSSVIYRIETPRPPPSISVGGVVNAATFEVGAGLAPGSLATVFGIGLATSTEVAQGFPLPTDLGGGSMSFNGSVRAPQIFARPGQRNFQVPWELDGLAHARLAVTVGGEISPAVVVPLARISPGVFVINYSGQAAALIASSGGVVAGPAGSFTGARPARPGDTLEVFATGLGPVTNPPATGAAALADPVSTTIEPVSARVGGQPMRVVFSGLASSFAGLYRIKLELVGEVPSGDAVPLVIQVGGIDSNTTFIAVQKASANDTTESQP